MQRTAREKGQLGHLDVNVATAIDQHFPQWRRARSISFAIGQIGPQQDVIVWFETLGHFDKIGF
jgi:hypothetical protein